MNDLPEAASHSEETDERRDEPDVDEQPEERRLQDERELPEPSTPVEEEPANEAG